MKKNICIILLSLISLYSFGQEKNFKYGKLANGLTYYVRHTDMDKGKADFYLVQNVGALMENDNQNGLAHVLEHMAFHATKCFPEGVPSFLYKLGFTDFNAYTGQDETVYHINGLPTTRLSLVDSCVLILRDWSGCLLLKKEDIEKERHIIFEERRQRRDLRTRMQEEVNDIMYNGSKYATHDVIGSLKVLENFTQKELMQYYKDFYRPDLQAVIIIGDIDINQVEDKIKEYFNEIPKRKKEKGRHIYTIADNTEPLYKKVFDKQVPGHAMILIKRFKKAEVLTMDELAKHNLIVYFYNKILSDYLQQYVNDEDPDFLQASIAVKSLVRGFYGLNIFMRAFPGQERKALLQLFTAFKQINTNAINDNVLNKLKDDYLVGLDDTEKNKDNLSNDVYVQIYKNNFLENNPITSIDEDIAVSRKILKTLSAADIKKWISTWWSNPNNWCYMMQGKDPNYDFPSKDEITNIIQQSRDAKIKDYNLEEVKCPEFVIDSLPTKGVIVKIDKIPQLDAECWTLSNGAHVFYKYTDDKIRKFNLFCEGRGGHSLLKAADLPVADMLKTQLFLDGFYKYSKKEFELLQQKHLASISIELNETNELIATSGDISNKETPFKFAYLAFHKPRLNKEKFEKQVFAQKMEIEMSPLTLIDTMQNAMRDFVTVKSERTLTDRDVHYFDNITYENLIRVYNDRFSDASNFNFFIVGDIPIDDAKSLVEKYIGALPSTFKHEKAFHFENMCSSSKRSDLELDIPDDKYMVQIQMYNQLKLSAQEILEVDIISSLLQKDLMQQIREKNNAAYGVQVTAKAISEPDNKQVVMISFQSSLEKGPAMRKLVYQRIDSLIQGKITDEDIIYDMPLIMKRSLLKMQDNKDIRYWMNALKQYADNGKYVDSTAKYLAVVDDIDDKSVIRTASKLFAHPIIFDLVIKSKPLNSINEDQKSLHKIHY